MQIHELNNFTGTLGAGSYVAIDDGNDTGKLSTQQLLSATEARIDNIIAGPAPSAEEIVDARLGADGVTYPSLGDAIRDQVSDLKAESNEIAETIGFTNYTQSLGLAYGKSLNVSNGAVIDNADFAVVDGFIPVDYGDKVKIHWTGTTVFTCLRCYYDANQNFITGVNYGATSPWEFLIADKTVKYVRISASKTVSKNLSIRVSSDKVTENRAYITEVYEDVGLPHVDVKDLEQGGFDANGLNDNSRTDCMRSVGYIEVVPNARYKVGMTINQSTAPNIGISFYSVADGTTPRIGYTLYVANENEFTVPSDAKYIRILARMTGDPFYLGYVTSLYMRLAKPLTKSLQTVIDSVDASGNDLVIQYANPTILSTRLSLISSRRTQQDIAVYDGTIVESDVGKININGTDIQINNGHGNNCDFGRTLHGTFPYLYCGSWDEDSATIYVNEITATSATFVRLVNFNLEGYLNMAVDETGNRFYIFNADDPYTGNITFIASDLYGNIQSTKELGIQIPIIQGMTFFDGHIYVVSGSPNTGDKLYIYCFDTDGNLISRTSKIGTSEEPEGISYDVDGTLYFATISKIYKSA